MRLGPSPPVAAGPWQNPHDLTNSFRPRSSASGETSEHGNPLPGQNLRFALVTSADASGSGHCAGEIAADTEDTYGIARNDTASTRRVNDCPNIMLVVSDFWYGNPRGTLVSKGTALPHFLTCQEYVSPAEPCQGLFIDNVPNRCYRCSNCGILLSAMRSVQ